MSADGTIGDAGQAAPSPAPSAPAPSPASSVKVTGPRTPRGAPPGPKADAAAKADTVQTTGRRAPRERGPDGKFAGLNGLRTAAKAMFAEHEAKTGVIGTPAVADDEAAPAAETAEASAAEESAAPAAAESPDSWPEPAKKAHSEARAAYDAVARQNAEIRREAAATLKQATIADRRIKWLESAIEAAGLEIDPTAARLFDYEARDALEQGQSQREREHAEHQLKARVDQHLVQVKGEAARAAKQHGLDAEDILWAFASAGQRWQARGMKGPEPTVADAVKERLAVAAATQQAANAAAPALASRSAPSRPMATAQRPPNTPAGRLQFLKSRGHDI